MKKQKTFFRYVFETKDGTIIIGQWPNPPLIVWGVFAFFSFIFQESQFAPVFSTLSTWGLVVWAYLELVYGVNRFRKAIGALMLLYLTLRLFAFLV
jgi:hypothetical protein